MEIIEAIICIYQKLSSTIESIWIPVTPLVTKEMYFNYLTLWSEISLPEVKVLEALVMYSRTFFRCVRELLTTLNFRRSERKYWAL